MLVSQGILYGAATVVGQLVIEYFLCVGKILGLIMLRLVQSPSSGIVQGIGGSAGDGRSTCGRYLQSGDRRICRLWRPSNFHNSRAWRLCSRFDLPAFGAKTSRQTRMAATR